MEMSTIEVVKMGVKGHLIMPQVIREKLGVDKGSNVAWVIKNNGEISIRALNEQTFEIENEFEKALKTAGITYDEWQENRAIAFQKAYPELNQELDHTHV